MNGWLLVAALVAQATPPQTAAPTAARPWNLVIHGQVSALLAGYPNQDDTRELRTRASIDMTADPTTWLRLHLDGLAEVLAADRTGRVDDPTPLLRSFGVTSGIASVRDAWAELRLKDVEVRAGYGRLVWGRLDEVMPSDVINPIDTARFFLDGRADARLPVAFVRTRVFLPSETSVETVVALPGRRGRFDSLDEPTSPFNLRGRVSTCGKLQERGDLGSLEFSTDRDPSPYCLGLDRREEPPASWRNLQGGLRVSTTAGRVDMSMSAWRGFEAFGIIGFEPLAFPMGPGPTPTVVGTLVERYPRFTMIAADAEMVQGGWALRGEVAGFVDKTLNGPSGPEKGKAIDAGVGVDRAAGEYHVFGSLVWHREWFTTSPSSPKQHLNVIASVDRRFSQEKYLARLFGVWNPEDRSGFVRGLTSWSIRDNLLLEASGGAFLGQGTDTISRFADRDFFFLRARYSF